jgi:hypothetical protein
VAKWPLSCDFRVFDCSKYGLVEKVTYGDAKRFVADGMRVLESREGATTIFHTTWLGAEELFLALSPLAYLGFPHLSVKTVAWCLSK